MGSRKKQAQFPAGLFVFCWIMFGNIPKAKVNFSDKSTTRFRELQSYPWKGMNKMKRQKLELFLLKNILRPYYIKSLFHSADRVHIYKG